MKIEELFELLLSEKPSKQILEKEEEIFTLIPELKNGKNFNQNNIWHLYDVYHHILHVLDETPPILSLRVAALFHDIGKPDCYTEDENKVGHFYGHWEKSEQIFCEFAKKQNLPSEFTTLVSKLILYHDLNISKLASEELEKFLNLFTWEELELLYQLKRADLLAQNSKFHYLLEDYETQKQKLYLKYK